MCVWVHLLVPFISFVLFCLHMVIFIFKKKYFISYALSLYICLFFGHILFGDFGLLSFCMWQPYFIDFDSIFFGTIVVAICLSNSFLVVLFIHWYVLLAPRPSVSRLGSNFFWLHIFGLFTSTRIFHITFIPYNVVHRQRESLSRLPEKALHIFD